MEEDACARGLACSRATDFEILRTGIGAKNAERTLAARLDDPSRPFPALVISTGFAGSAVPDIRVGDWIVGVSVEIEDGRPIGCTAPWPANPSTVKSGRVFTARAVTNHPAASADAVDMESYALAEVADRRQAPFAILRAISDSVEDPLPEFLPTLTAIATAEHLGEKVRFALKGLRQLGARPGDLARLKVRAAALRRLLEDGWSRWPSYISQAGRYQ
jgi:hypothetical protein